MAVKLGLIRRRLLAGIAPVEYKADIDLIAGDAEQDLKGRRGVFRPYRNVRPDGSEVLDADVCCPGCGEMVCHLDPERYPFSGDLHALTCAEPIHFEACCGWYGVLRNGVWRGR